MSDILPIRQRDSVVARLKNDWKRPRPPLWAGISLMLVGHRSILVWIY